MSNQKIKNMGNLSRASEEMRKKLELSFTPQPPPKPINENTEVNKSVSTEINKVVNTKIGKSVSKEVNKLANTEIGKSVSPEVGKSINTEIPFYGQVDFKPTSINTEDHINQNSSIQSDQPTALKIGSRYKKIVPRATNTLKAKATFCLDMVAVEQLNMIYIKRLSSHQKSDRSSLICEAISLLFEKEKLG